MNAKGRFQISDHIDGRYGQGKALRLILRAPQAARIWLHLVENDGTYEGPGYAAAFEIPAGKDWQTRVIPLKDFAHEGKADGNGKLDIDRVWMVQVADITARDTPAPAELEIDGIGMLLGE
jgi:hypothetical protein